MHKGMLFGCMILSSVGILGSEEGQELSQPQVEACSTALLEAVRTGYEYRTFLARYPRCFDQSAKLRPSVTAMASHRAYSENDKQSGREILDLRNPDWQQSKERYVFGAYCWSLGVISGGVIAKTFFKSK
jgi:hypothetical protein